MSVYIIQRDGRSAQEITLLDRLVNSQPSLATIEQSLSEIKESLSKSNHPHPQTGTTGRTPLHDQADAKENRTSTESPNQLTSTITALQTTSLQNTPDIQSLTTKSMATLKESVDQLSRKIDTSWNSMNTKISELERSIITLQTETTKQYKDSFEELKVAVESLKSQTVKELATTITRLDSTVESLKSLAPHRPMNLKDFTEPMKTSSFFADAELSFQSCLDMEFSQLLALMPHYLQHFHDLMCDMKQKGGKRDADPGWCERFARSPFFYQSLVHLLLSVIENIASNHHNMQTALFPSLSKQTKESPSSSKNSDILSTWMPSLIRVCQYMSDFKKPIFSSLGPPMEKPFPASSNRITATTSDQTTPSLQTPSPPALITPNNTVYIGLIGTFDLPKLNKAIESELEREFKQLSGPSHTIKVDWLSQAPNGTHTHEYTIIAHVRIATGNRVAVTVRESLLQNSGPCIFMCSSTTAVNREDIFKPGNEFTPESAARCYVATYSNNGNTQDIHDSSGIAQFAAKVYADMARIQPSK